MPPAAKKEKECIKDLSKTKAPAVWIICSRWHGWFGRLVGRCLLFNWGLGGGGVSGRTQQNEANKTGTRSAWVEPAQPWFPKVRSFWEAKACGFSLGISQPSPKSGLLPVLLTAERQTPPPIQQVKPEIGKLSWMLISPELFEFTTVSRGFHLLRNSKCLLHCSTLQPC